MKVAKLVPLVLMLMFIVLAMAEIPAPVSAQTPVATEDLSPSTFQQFDAIRAATAKYRDVETAKAEGYGKFLTCFRHGNDMGMGQHFVNGTLAGDDVLDPMKPEALVYEPRPDGTLILAAFEYLVFDKTWDPNHTGRPAPTVFGHPLQLLTNIPDTPPVWGLHLWLWSYNPEGVFASFNPTVSCPSGQDSIDMSKM